MTFFYLYSSIYILSKMLQIMTRILQNLSDCLFFLFKRMEMIWRRMTSALIEIGKRAYGTSESDMALSASPTKLSHESLFQFPLNLSHVHLRFSIYMYKSGNRIYLQFYSAYKVTNTYDHTCVFIEVHVEIESFVNICRHGRW